MEAFLRTKIFVFFKYFVRIGNSRYLGKKQNISFSQNLPNMGGESGIVLRLRLTRKLVISHNDQIKTKAETSS